jgi:Glycosyltransferase family 87
MGRTSSILVIIVAIELFAGSWVLLHRLWYAVEFPQESYDVSLVYEPYGDAISAGRVPYRDFVPEYPPAALVPFVAPELTAHQGDTVSYSHAFERWMAAVGALILLLTAASLSSLRASAARFVSALALIAISPLLIGSLMLVRFDLWPAALTAAAVAALLAGRDRLGAVAIGVGTAAKLYPAVLLPLGIAWVWRRQGRRAAFAWTSIVAGVCAAVFLPFVALSPRGVGHSFGLQLGRPLQIESLGAAILIAAHHLTGLALTVSSSYGSQNVAGSAAGAIGTITTVAQALALGGVWLAFARGPAHGERLVTAVAASVAVFIAFGKVFSPQFMIWLIPLVPLVRSRLAALLFAGALVLTQFEWPDRYWPLVFGFRPLVSWAVLARDLLVLGLGAALTWKLTERDALDAAV